MEVCISPPLSLSGVHPGAGSSNTLFYSNVYKAVNWIKVGKTKGRGKLGPPGKRTLPIKAIWLFLNFITIKGLDSYRFPLQRRYLIVQ